MLGTVPVNKKNNQTNKIPEQTPGKRGWKGKARTKSLGGWGKSYGRGPASKRSRGWVVSSEETDVAKGV